LHSQTHFQASRLDVVSRLGPTNPNGSTTAATKCPGVRFELGVVDPSGSVTANRINVVARDARQQWMQILERTLNRLYKEQPE
jgi:hypothetical protein